MRQSPSITPPEDDSDDDDQPAEDEPAPHEQMRLDKMPPGPPPPGPLDWLNSWQAAKVLGIEVDALHALYRRGLIVAWHSGGDYLVRRDRLTEWAAILAAARAYVCRIP